MDPAGLAGGGGASPWSRALALLGCAALAGLIVWMLVRRSDDDASLVVEGPRLPADAIQVEQHTLLPARERPQRELGGPDTSPVGNEPDAGLSARVPEPVLLPPTPPAPPALTAPVALTELPVALGELPPTLNQAPALDEVPDPAALTALDEVLPPPADEHALTSDAGTSSVSAVKVAAPPPPRPPPLRGTNNAPIFD